MVLVVIGLIVGGILYGQDMIKQATLRATLSQLQQFQTAMAAFQGKYNCLPGDCANAFEAFGFTSKVTGYQNDGNGDGMIGQTNGYLFSTFGQIPTNEPLAFWAHLAQAGYITIPTLTAGLGIPSKLAGTQWWAAYSAHTTATSWPFLPTPTGLGNVIALVGQQGCGFLSCGGVKFSEGLTPEDAYALDAKTDDGMPLTGSVQAASSGNYIDAGPISTDWTAAPNLCVNGSDSSAATPYARAAANSLARCNLVFKLGF